MFIMFWDLSVVYYTYFPWLRCDKFVAFLSDAIQLITQLQPDDAPIPDSSPTTIFPGAEKTTLRISRSVHIISSNKMTPL